MRHAYKIKQKEKGREPSIVSIQRKEPGPRRRMRYEVWEGEHEREVEFTSLRSPVQHRH
jgi:hypothetical protein